MSTKHLIMGRFLRFLALVISLLVLIVSFGNAKAAPALQTGVAPNSITVNAPSTGTTGQSYTFTISVGPQNVTTPLTYTWRVTKDDGTTDQITHTNGVQDSLSYTWAYGGFKYILLTVANGSGSLNKEIYFPVQVPAFLYPPYPGSVMLYTVFDHDAPDYGKDGSVLTWKGENFSNVSYPGHAGIDYTFGYLPIYAAANSDRVARVEWDSPTDHTAGLGLFVELVHANGYHTLYGHLSSTSVKACTLVYCKNVKRGETLGISGNTGNSTGPHLHFEVRNPLVYLNNTTLNRPIPVDPYGYSPIATSANQTPKWLFTQPNTLWAQLPSLNAQPLNLGDNSKFPSGSQELALPRPPTGGATIDDYGHLPNDSAPNFNVSPGCWQRSTQKTLGYATNNYNLYKAAVISTTAGDDRGTCWARWYLPADQPAGEYSIYVHVPRSDTEHFADNALYRVYRAGNEVAKINVSQFAINETVLRGNTYSADPTVNAGWVYIGNYLFAQSTNFGNYVELTDKVVGNTINTADNTDHTVVPDPLIAVDSVRFAKGGSSSNVDVALVIDSSGSMSSNDPNSVRLQASRSYVTNASFPGDYVGIVDFDDTVRVATNPPLQLLHDNDAGVIAAINTIDAFGGTNIGLGIQKGCDVLRQSQRLDYRKGAILLTDGDGSYAGEDSCFQGEGWPLFTFGFGSANDALLQQVASETGGNYERVNNLDRLGCEFARVRALIANVEPPPCIGYTVLPLSTLTLAQTIPPGQAQATFSTGWPGSDVVMTLTTPSGRVIDRNTAAADVNHQLGATYEFYTITNPEAGNWTVKLYGANVPAGGEETIFGFVSIPAPTTVPNACVPSNSYASSSRNGAKVANLTASNLTDFQGLPLAFVPNAGQEDGAVQFQVQGLGGKVFFTPGEIVFSLPNPTRVAGEGQGENEKIRFDLQPANVVRMHYLGANGNPPVMALGQLPGVVNILTGDDPSKWQTNLPTYSGIAYQDLYPGIELRYEGTGGNLKSTFHVAPGADPAAITWRYLGPSDVRVDASGNLVVSMKDAAGIGATLVEKAPIAWQEVNGAQTAVPVQYALDQSGKIGFSFPSGFDATLPLVIDPTLSYSTYLGGTTSDQAQAITLDANCNIYVTGVTYSTNFPTATPFQTNQPLGDVFVTKLNAAGNTVLYSTYLGGGGSDHAKGIGLDSQGRITIVGETESSNFPMKNAYDSTYGGGTCPDGPCDDVFVTQLMPDGSALRYSTYLGGGADDEGNGMVVGPDDMIYLAGWAKSSTFPKVRAYDSTFGGGTCDGAPCEDGFVAKVNPAVSGSSSLVYSTFLGGGDYDKATAIALDASGKVYVTGFTRSTNFPILNAYQPAPAGNSEIFVAKLDTTLTGTASLLYSTYLGGSGSDHAYGIALNGANQVYLTGWTRSADLPLVNAFDTTFGGGTCGTTPCYDSYVSYLNISSNTLIYSSYLGGSEEELGTGITIDNSGNAYVTGYTKSSDFPTVDALQGVKGLDSCGTPPCSDAFVVKVNPTGNALIYATYLGGSAEDYGNAIITDGLGSAYIVGYTFSDNFPTTPESFPYIGTSTYSDTFVVKIGD